MVTAGGRGLGPAVPWGCFDGGVLPEELGDLEFSSFITWVGWFRDMDGDGWIFIFWKVSMD